MFFNQNLIYLLLDQYSYEIVFEHLLTFQISIDQYHMTPGLVLEIKIGN
jgi:hypothetical protein